MKILLSQWMQELDAETINRIGIPSIVLMENASRGAADFFASQFPLSSFKHAIIVAGKGNNGGDGLAIGRILYQKGYSVEFTLLSDPTKLNPDPKINFDILKKLSLPITIIDNVSDISKFNIILDKYKSQDTFLIDAIFGTGINQPVKQGLYADVIRIIRDSSFKIAAVDIPSGLSDAFLPEEGFFIPADVTATFQCLKTAHIYPDGNKFCGKIQIIDIGIPNHLIANEKYYIQWIDSACFTPLTAPRPVDAHKGTFGHSLTVCGSIEKPGAGILSSFAVLKSGAGLCTTAVPFENRTIPVTVHPELMTIVYNQPADLLDRLNEFNCILAGPGLGNTENTAQIISTLLEKFSVPLVLDADALNVLSARKDILKKPRNFPVVLTPHPGEFSKLTGRSTRDVTMNRVAFSRAFAIEYNVYLILKGHHTLVVTPQGMVFVNPTGNPGMATAGSGDVLSGMITGMISQYFSRFSLDLILQFAVLVHGYAGDFAAKQAGQISLTASDILRFIPDAIMHLDDYINHFRISC